MSAENLINYIEFIENTEFQLNDDVQKQVDAASPTKLMEFRKLYMDLNKAFDVAKGNQTPATLAKTGQSQLGRVFACPDAKPGEFRPVFHGRLMDFGESILGGDSGSAFENLALGSRLRRVKALLLYSHSIVVPDSLFYINQFFDRPDDLSFEKGRNWLKNYLTIITALRPLIERNIIIFYPQYEHTGNGFAFPMGDSYEEQEFVEWLAKRYTEDQFEHKRVLSRQLNELQFYADRYDGSLLLPETELSEVLEENLRFANGLERKDKRRDQYLASALANVDLPNLDKLKVTDIIAIRQDNASFEQWRNMLSEAVEKINRYEEANFETTLKETKEILREGQDAIHEEVGKSGFWQSVKGPLGTFALACMGTLGVKGVTSDTPTDIGVDATVAGLSFLYQYITGGKKRRAQQALKKHFATFTTRNEKKRM